MKPQNLLGAMKKNDIVTIATVALGTATLTVLTFWSCPLGAGPEETLAAKIAQPKLVAHGVELTLTTAAGRTFKAGDEPVFELKAVNTTCESVTVEVGLTMTSSSPRDLMSRVEIMPTMLWQQHQTLALKPKETKVITVATQKKLPANTMVSVSLGEVDPLKQPPVTAQPAPLRSPNISLPGGIMALSFSTVVPAAQPVLASAK
jgi:hypothetical protein